MRITSAKISVVQPRCGDGWAIGETAENRRRGGLISPSLELMAFTGLALVVFVIGVAFQPRAEPLDVSHQGEPVLVGLVGEPSKSQGYSGIGEPSESVGRLEEVDGVPIVRAASSFPAQVGTDAAGAEHARAVGVRSDTPVRRRQVPNGVPRWRRAG